MAKNSCIAEATFKTIDPEILNFDFLEKSLEIVSLPHFVYGFSTKMFLMLFSIN